MNHTDVFYRDVSSPPPSPTTATAAPAATSGGLLSPILGPISPILGSLPGQVLQPLLPRQIDANNADSQPALLPLPISVSVVSNSASPLSSSPSATLLSFQIGQTENDRPLLMDDTTIIIDQTLSVLSSPVETAISFEADITHENNKLVGFSGIFFR